MRKYILLFFLLFFLKNQAQFKFLQSYYFDCSESSYQMNYGITLSSIEGNYKKANELVQSSFFKANPDKAVLINALITYNTKGKKSAHALVDQTLISEEEKEFAKLWLSFYVKNTVEYKERLADFKKKYPNNYQPIRLKLREVLDYRDKKIWNSTYTQKQTSLQSIDSLLNSVTLKKEDQLFFSLMKLDFLSKEETNLNDDKKDPAFKSENEIIEQLLNLWDENKSEFNSNFLLQKIGDCNNSKCKEAINYITTELRKTSTSSSSEKVFGILINQNNATDNKLSISELEKTLSELILQEKNNTEILKIKGLVTVFSLSKQPDLGFFMSGLLKPISFSSNFKTKYANTQTKEEILKSILELLKEPTFAEIVDENELQTKLKDNFGSIKSLSIEDIQAAYGLLVFSLNYNKFLVKSMNESFGMYTNSPNYSIENDWTKYISFIEENPLYFKDSKYLAGYPELKSEEEVLSLIQETKRLKEKFPGSAAILNNCIFTLALNNKLVSANQKQNYYLNYIQFVFDVFQIMSNKTVGNNDEDVDYFGTIINYESDWSIKHFEKFYSLLSKPNQLASEEYLKKYLSENPNQKNLLYFDYLIKKSKGGKEYFDNYIRQLQENKSIDKLNYSLIGDVDPAYISTKLDQTIEIFKTQKNLSGLRTILEILYDNSKNNEAIDVILFILRNADKESYFYYDFIENFPIDFYSSYSTDEEIISKLSEIQNEFPSLELNYLLLAAMKLELEDLHKEGIKMINEYKNQEFTLTMSNYQMYHKLKRFLQEFSFEEETTDLIINEITKKNPELLNDLKD